MPEPTSGTGRPTSAELAAAAAQLERDGALLDMTAADYRATVRAVGAVRDELAAEWLRLLAIADAVDGVKADHQEGTMTTRRTARARQRIDRWVQGLAAWVCARRGHKGPGWQPFCGRCGADLPGWQS